MSESDSGKRTTQFFLVAIRASSPVPIEWVEDAVDQYAKAKGNHKKYEIDMVHVEDRGV